MTVCAYGRICGTCGKWLQVAHNRADDASRFELFSPWERAGFRATVATRSHEISPCLSILSLGNSAHTAWGQRVQDDTQAT
jgi:hypothetical protein